MRRRERRAGDRVWEGRGEERGGQEGTGEDGTGDERRFAGRRVEEGRGGERSALHTPPELADGPRGESVWVADP